MASPRLYEQNGTLTDVGLLEGVLGAPVVHELLPRDEALAAVLALGANSIGLQNRLNIRPKKLPKGQLEKDTCINCFRCYTASIKKVEINRKAFGRNRKS